MALIEDVINEGFILIGLYMLIEAEGEVWMELYFEDWLELVDDFGKKWWKVVCEGILGCRWVIIETFL